MTPNNTTDPAAARIAEIRAIAREKLPALPPSVPQRRVDRDLVRALGDSGLLASLFPARFGGSAAGPLSVVDLCLLREGLAYESTAASTALALQAGGSFLFIEQAQPHIAEQWVPKVVAGTAVAAIALTEPNVGSDLSAMELRAIPEADGWTLNGEKAWIMNAPDADVYTVFAKSTPDSGRNGISAFVVPGDTAGLSGTPIDSMWPGAVGRLTFNDVHVPNDHLLGAVDDGFRAGLSVFDTFRPAVAAHALGVASRALDESVSYASTRTAFGQVISGFQAVSHSIADMATQLEAARLLVYRAASACDEGRPDTASISAMAKLFATETAGKIVDQALQIHGASGLECTHLMAHLYSEIRASRIYEGTSEIQRNIIARAILNRHAQR